MKLDNSLSGAIRTFSYFLASGTHEFMKGIEYVSLYGKEPSAIEMVYAIFINVIEIDENGILLNEKYAERRALQYLKDYCDPSYNADPPFEDWEITLY